MVWLMADYDAHVSGAVLFSKLLRNCRPKDFYIGLLSKASPFACVVQTSNPAAHGVSKIGLRPYLVLLVYRPQHISLSLSPPSDSFTCPSLPFFHFFYLVLLLLTCSYLRFCTCTLLFCFLYNKGIIGISYSLSLQILYNIF